MVSRVNLTKIGTGASAFARKNIKLSQGCRAPACTCGDLGRGLISAQPNPNRSEFDEGKVVCGQFIISGGDAPALLDLIEEALHQIACPIQIWAKTDWVFAISLRRNVSPRTSVTGERS
jgi:hypothetical protein